MIEWQDVYSTAVGTVGYDAEKQELHVIWARNGKRSVYSGVSPEQAQEIANAPSVGQAVRELPQESHRYV